MKSDFELREFQYIEVHETPTGWGMNLEESLEDDRMWENYAGATQGATRGWEPRCTGSR